VLYSKLLDRFRESQRLAVADLRQAIPSGRRVDAIRRAHTLRSVAGSIGARAVQQTAETLERYLEQRVTVTLADPQLSEHLQTLDDALSHVVIGLDNHFSANLAAPQEPVPAAGASIEAATAALAELNALLDAFSGRSLAYFDSIKPALRQLLDEATLERLSTHIRQFEFEEAQRLLETI
jgi:HPt (histidine-containing phosphotransfer) domain-containing protein